MNRLARAKNYQGMTVLIQKAGESAAWVPLLHLAAEWELDYKKIRSVCQQNPHLGSEKIPIAVEGHETVYVCILEESLPALADLL